MIEERIEQDKIDLRALFKQVDRAVIEKWESDPEKFYVANHPVIAVTELGGLLFYDSRTRAAEGEMELCWASEDDGNHQEALRKHREVSGIRFAGSKKAAGV